MKWAEKPKHAESSGFRSTVDLVIVLVVTRPSAGDKHGLPAARDLCHLKGFNGANSYKELPLTRTRSTNTREHVVTIERWGSSKKIYSQI